MSLVSRPSLRDKVATSCELVFLIDKHDLDLSSSVLFPSIPCVKATAAETMSH